MLELGCGTGFLTEHLLRSYPAAECLITDLSPRMVEVCREKLAKEKTNGHAGPRFRVMDARRIDAPGVFDLIASNLLFQWFDDLPRAVAHAATRLAPGGVLVLNTLGAGSFSYWHRLDAQTAGPPTAPVFPTHEAIVEGLRTSCPGLKIQSDVEDHVARHPDFADFLNHLKTIGAGTPIGAPRGVARLREVLRCTHATRSPASVEMNYEVVTITACRSRR